MQTVTVFNILTGNKEQFELVDLQDFSTEKYTPRQITILSKMNSGIAILRQKRTLYRAYYRKDGGFGSASKVTK